MYVDEIYKVFRSDCFNFCNPLSNPLPSAKRLSFPARKQVIELFSKFLKLKEIDEGVDACIQEQHHLGEMIEGTLVPKLLCYQVDIVEKIQRLVPYGTEKESHNYNYQCFQNVTFHAILHDFFWGDRITI
jgi:hypothetical protein